MVRRECRVGDDRRGSDDGGGPSLSFSILFILAPREIPRRGHAPGMRGWRRPGEAPPGSRGGLRARPDLHSGAVAVTRPRGRATATRRVRAAPAVRSRTGGGPLHLKNTRGKTLCSTSAREATVRRRDTPSTATTAMATAPFSPNKKLKDVELSFPTVCGTISFWLGKKASDE